MKIGEVGVYKGVSHAAASRYRLRILGAGGHAATPQHTQDSILAGVHIVSAWQSIVSRNLDPMGKGVQPT